jgi:hypothetical protein
LFISEKRGQRTIGENVQKIRQSNDSNESSACHFPMDEKRPFLLKPRSLAVWLAAGIGTFVLVGSVALMGFFQHLSRVEESVALESLGRTNALFWIKRACRRARKWPPSSGR